MYYQSDIKNVIRLISWGVSGYVYDLINYKTESGRVPIDDFIKDLTRKNKVREIAQINLYLDRLCRYGMQINNYYPESIRKMQDDVYELRPGGNRVFFFYFKDNQIVLLHAYKKHGRKAPTNQIQNAVNEMKDHKRRN